MHPPTHPPLNGGNEAGVGVGAPPPGNPDECALYMVTFFLDTTLGVYLCMIFLNFTSRRAYSLPGYLWSSWSRPGTYTKGREGRDWLEQCLQWCLVTVLMKVVIAMIVLVGQDQLIEAGAWMLSPLKER